MKHLQLAHNELGEMVAKFDLIAALETKQAECREAITKCQEQQEAIDQRHRDLANKHQREVDLHDRLLATKKAEDAELKSQLAKAKDDMSKLGPALAAKRAEHTEITAQYAALKARVEGR